jgi:transposase-like protein
MPRKCTICEDATRRRAVDRQIVLGASYRGIARQHGVSPDAVERHAASHLPASLTRSQALRDMIATDDLVGEIRELRLECYAILSEARTERQRPLSLAAVDRLAKLIDLLARVRGDIQSGTTVNVAQQQAVVRVYEFPDNGKGAGYPPPAEPIAVEPKPPRRRAPRLRAGRNRRQPPRRANLLRRRRG